METLEEKEKVENFTNLHLPLKLKDKLTEAMNKNCSLSSSHIAHTDQGQSDHYDYYSDR